MYTLLLKLNQINQQKDLSTPLESEKSPTTPSFRTSHASEESPNEGFN